MLERWRKYATLLLAERGFVVDDVKTGVDAWNVAHRLNIPREAYHVDGSINDTHIETALRKIFPRAIFKSDLKKEKR